MLFSALVLFFALASAQEGEDGDASTFDQIKDKVSEIVSGAAISCSNKYIAGPYIESVLCDGIVPEEYTAKIGVKFGAETDWCSALACVYRAMGCAAPTYRIEAKIIKATGAKEECAETVGLDAEHCNTLAKFIAKAPAATAQKKRAPMDAREAKLAAALAIKSYAPQTAGLDDLFDNLGFTENALAKRGIEDQLQVCSPLIAAGLELLESSINLPLNFSDHLGPCGTICNYAVCGLNILCGATAEPLLEEVNRNRGYGGCAALSCAHFIQAPESKCQDVTCPQPVGYYNEATCPPPKLIHNPTKVTADDCCQRCDDACNGVRCPAVSCPEPEYPLCAPYRVAKYDAFDCCEQCIDPCFTAKQACPQPPTSCPAGQFLGPAHPGDCCLSCQPKCVGVSCTGGPLQASDCPEGTVFQDVVESPSKCSDCCPSCVPLQVDQVADDASSVAAVAAAAAVAGAAATL